jgi:2-C-methyl-D-erythritol 4-phosphate cytidylyltransferase
MTSSKVGAIIVAAGKSERMGGGDKLLAPVAGRPLIAYSIEVFVATAVVDEVVVVASSENRKAIEEMVADAEAGKPRLRGSEAGDKGRMQRISVVEGGARRRDSVRAGIEALPDCEYVVVHDGARPLVSPELIEVALAGARETGAALCAMPVADTVKRSDPSTGSGQAGGLVRTTVSRDGLWLAQTPQAFRRELLLRAHDSTDVDATDDAALIEWLGEPVRLVMGSARNVKVTSPEDLALVEALLKAKPA